MNYILNTLPLFPIAFLRSASFFSSLKASFIIFFCCRLAYKLFHSKFGMIIVIVHFSFPLLAVFLNVFLLSFRFYFDVHPSSQPLPFLPLLRLRQYSFRLLLLLSSPLYVIITSSRIEFRNKIFCLKKHTE